MNFKENFLRCYLIGGSQDTNHDPDELLTKVEQAIDNGITAFQYREKGSSSLNDEDKLILGKKLQKLCQNANIPFIIDDDLELAKSLHADGIHVGQKDQRVEQVLKEVGQDMFVGYSCSTPEQIEHANNLSVAYVGSGPVYPTQSKKDADPVLGIDGLTNLVKLSKHPIVAIGGITENNMAGILKSGCSGLSMISMVLQSPNIPKTIHAINSLYK